MTPVIAERLFLTIVTILTEKQAIKLWRTE